MLFFFIIVIVMIIIAGKLGIHKTATHKENPGPQPRSCLPKISFARFYRQEQGVEAVGTSS